MPSSGTVSALLVRPLANALASSSDALAAFFRATDLTPELVADDDARVAASRFCIAWVEALRLSGDRLLPFHLADSLPPGAFGLVEYVCRASATLGEALRQWVRYLNLLDDAVEVGLVEEDDRSSIRVVTESEAPAPASHELCFAMLAREARRVASPPVRALEVRFTHRAPAEAAAFRRFFDAPVAFDQEHTELVFSRAALDTPFASADANLLAILRRHASAMQAEDRGTPTVTARLRRELANALRDGDDELDRLARRLGLTGRNLQRRLKDEGTSFQAVRDDVRRELAKRYLDDELSIAEVSFLLGFSEPSAFFRAFKRWTGLTPLESRDRRRAPA